MIGKSVYLLAFFLSIVAIVNASDEDGSHHMTIGIRLPGDHLVSAEAVIEHSQWLKVLSLEKMFFAPPNQRITMIRALDQKTNGKGATVSLLNGGPDSTEATLKFKSKRGHGINFIVEIYAK